MRVRIVHWYLTEGEYIIRKYNPELATHWSPDEWSQYSFLEAFWLIHTRDEFEKRYLEWKVRNEG